ncbi:hypothetical protein Pmani_035105 [Petrolisthes manimaculis]|uniref:Neurotransmitter-gated ion-channel ligand-binding domain-containing protein n=1 Tax=Petrolisthes manimaculis TaxID=1843537 RepID=A0AAE1NMD6_9EUCA|nr:hypothetical protein Pmani_035105 [Petrolisthes manimaculis]
MFSPEDDLTSDNWIKRLYKDKMSGYDKEARPVHDHTHNTTLHMALSINHVDLDDVKQELSVSAWTIMTWTDEFLRWVPMNYMNIDRLHFDDKDIWLPDITVYNSADGSHTHPFDKVPVLADNTGQVFWFPPTHLRVKCDLDLTLWPSDSHRCVVRMGSWSHHGEQIDIQVMSLNETDGVMLTNFETNNRWELVKVSASRSVVSLEGHDPYIEVNFAFEVKRHASTHAQYLTQASLAVVVVVLASYLLPLTSHLSRLLMHLFGLTILITCYFTLFTTLPANGGPVPVVVRYFSGTIILTTISLLSTLILTVRPCCSSSTSNSSSSYSSYSSSSSSGLGKRLAGAVTSSRVLRSVLPHAGGGW